jgi:DNA-binding MarR family transcriptional regulator
MAATRELQRVNRTLRRMAGTNVRDGGAADSAAADARAIVAARRLCQARFGLDLGDTGWMLLLEAFTARIEGRRLAVTSLGAAGGITRTTAYRWTRRLLERGLLSGVAAREGGRATFVLLADDAAEGIRASLAEARALSSRAG